MLYKPLGLVQGVQDAVLAGVVSSRTASLNNSLEGITDNVRQIFVSGLEYYPLPQLKGQCTALYARARSVNLSDLPLYDGQD